MAKKKTGRKKKPMKQRDVKVTVAKWRTLTNEPSELTEYLTIHTKQRKKSAILLRTTVFDEDGNAAGVSMMRMDGVRVRRHGMTNDLVLEVITKETPEEPSA